MRRVRAIAACVLGLRAAFAVAVPLDPGKDSADAGLERMLRDIAAAKLPAALEQAERLAARYPNWRLAHLVHGDLLRARGAPITAFGGAAGARAADLRDEAQARLRALRERPAADAVPRYLLQFDRAQSSAIIVDAERSRVYVYENADRTARLVQDFYSTLGKNGIDKLRAGDRKTPLGVYHVTAMIPGRKLPDLYGWGAFPISYPNEWDRMAGRTGYGIWLHGVPSDTYARSPRASDGCVALANADIAEMAKRIRVGATPVIIAERIEWTTPQAVRDERAAFLRVLDAWRRDWESRDTERYLGHYARGFHADGRDLAAWSQNKRRVNAAKRWIKVTLDNVSLLRSPGKQELMVVSFDQDYRSSNLNERMRKRQYWIMQDGRWRIAHEAAADGATVSMPESFPRRRPAAASVRR